MQFFGFLDSRDHIGGFNSHAPDSGLRPQRAYGAVSASVSGEYASAPSKTASRISCPFGFCDADCNRCFALRARRLDWRAAGKLRPGASTGSVPLFQNKKARRAGGCPRARVVLSKNTRILV